MNELPPIHPPTENMSFKELISFRLVTLANRITSAAASDVKAAADVSLMEWRLIVQIAAEPGSLPAQLAITAGVDKSQVSRAIQTLVKRDLLLIKADPRHPKRMRMFLNDASRSLYHQHYGAFIDRERRLVADLSSAEIALLSGLLERLNVGFRTDV